MITAQLALSFATRLGLLVMNGDWSMAAPAQLGPIIGIGLPYDLAVSACWALPFALLAWLWPDGVRSRRPFALLAVLLLAVAFSVLAFVSFAEFVFWNEFSSRFNFISVDYLIYSREVLGNIRESYPMTLLLTGVGTLTVLMLLFARRAIGRALTPTGSSFRTRGARFAALACLVLLLTWTFNSHFKDILSHPQAAQLAGNGTWEFFHAVRYNAIDYQRFYATVPAEQATRTLKAEFDQDNGVRMVQAAPMQIERDVRPTAPMKRLNVVLVSMESMGAEFFASLGGKSGLTPNMERLARESLYFTHVYATGTRTVRGLEALTLSLPPTPGQAVPVRPDNDGLFTIGGVFRDRGYDTLYLYGGYSYFDNMRTFFEGNGYTVIDRSAIAKSDITHENIWGVCDEDLYALTLRQLDQRYRDGKPFFAHVMTTSNHRPFTYPKGKVPLASGSGRDGAVQYADYALGKFVDEARHKPWFNETVFVIVADHTSIARGKTELELDRYHIPLLILAPSHFAPRTIATVASQIDVAPTLLGLLNFDYRSKFFGRDIIADGGRDQHVFLANYQTVGFMDSRNMIELRPQREVRITDPTSGSRIASSPGTESEVDEAISFYQYAALAFNSGALRTPAHGTLVQRLLPEFASGQQIP